MAKTKKTKTEQATPEVKLYKAYSIIESFAGRKNVKVEWFRHNRTEPVGPYAQLIEGFEELDEIEKFSSSGYLDELFTWNEVSWFEFDMEGYENAVKVIYEQVTLPIGPYDEDNAPYEHFGNRRIGNLEGYYMASELRGYDPSFPVWGYFDLNNTDPTEETAAKINDMGLYMLEKFIKAEGFDPDLSSEVIERKIGGLYDLYESYKKKANDILLLTELRKIPCKIGGMWQNKI